MSTRHWREWTEEERMRSRARAAGLFMNIHPCTDCGLDWPEGLVHDGCKGPLIPEAPKVEPTLCEGANDCEWQGIVIVLSKDGVKGGGSWRACREHAAPFRDMPERFTVIDAGLDNRRLKATHPLIQKRGTSRTLKVGG